MLVWMFAQALAVPPITIEVTDPAVVAVVLECSDGAQKAPVRNGIAEFMKTPRDCKINMIRRGPTLNQPGQWRCSLDECELIEVHHAPITDAPGRINIIFTKPVLADRIELQCGGNRQRAPISENTVTVDGVTKDCSMHFLGGRTTGVFSGLQPGTWYCTVNSPSVSCRKR